MNVPTFADLERHNHVSDLQFIHALEGTLQREENLDVGVIDPILRRVGIRQRLMRNALARVIRYRRKRQQMEKGPSGLLMVEDLLRSYLEKPRKEERVFRTDVASHRESVSKEISVEDILTGYPDHHI